MYLIFNYMSSRNSANVSHAKVKKDEMPNHKIYALVFLSFFIGALVTGLIAGEAINPFSKIALEVLSGFVIALIIALIVGRPISATTSFNYEKSILSFIGLGPLITAFYFSLNFLLLYESSITNSDIIAKNIQINPYSGEKEIVITVADDHLNQFKALTVFKNTEQNRELLQAEKIIYSLKTTYSGLVFVEDIQIVN